MVKDSPHVLRLLAYPTEHAPGVSSPAGSSAQEEFQGGQLSAVCHCGNAKVIGTYVCAACWEQVPEELKARLRSLESLKAEMRVVVHRIEQVASVRNPDRLRILNARGEGNKSAGEGEAAAVHQPAARDPRQVLRDHFGRLHFQMLLIEQPEPVRQTI